MNQKICVWSNSIDLTVSLPLDSFSAVSKPIFAYMYSFESS
jgi:hypothetical protein